MFQSNRSFYAIIYGFITKVFARFISKVVSNISRITIVFCLYFLVSENCMYVHHRGDDKKSDNDLFFSLIF